MGQRVRDSAITTVNARKKLAVSKVVNWRAMDHGAHIGYRKGMNGGTWVARYRKPGGTYITKALGTADDNLSADGRKVLDYSQAIKAARARCEKQAAGEAEETEKPYFVENAVEDYLVSYAQRGKSLREVTRQTEIDILPKLGRIPVKDLTTRTVRRWHESLAASPPRSRGAKDKPPKAREMPTDPEGIRRRQATANRILTTLKAVLNHAFNDNRVPNDEAWRRVKPFKNVESARVRYLTEDEAKRLINTCEPDFRNLVKGALLTGCRYGELTAAEVRDFNPDTCMLHVRYTKNDKPRYAPLTDNGCAFFERLSAGRSATEKMFLRADGQQWGSSHQDRRLRDACKVAKIDPPISFHILRHCYGSWLVMKGVSLQVVAEGLGHADTRTTSKHYAHLAPSHVADQIRANLPSLGVEESGPVVPMRRKK